MSFADRGYQALHRQGALPIVMDEGVISPIDAEEFIRLGMMDGLTIKISRAGGLESSRQQIQRVQDAGLFWLGSGLSDPIFPWPLHWPCLQPTVWKSPWP